jgi:hypothetical protein
MQMAPPQNALSSLFSFRRNRLPGREGGSLDNQNRLKDLLAGGGLRLGRSLALPG